MTHLHLTGLQIAALIVAALVLVFWLLMQRAGSRDAREIAEAAARAAQERQFADDVECFCMQSAVGADDIPSGLVEPGFPNDTLNGEAK